MNNGSHDLVALSPQEHVDINRQTGVYKHLNNKHLISREDPVIQEIQQLRESGLSFRQIARQVGYSYPTCYRIVSGTYPFQEPAKD